MSLAHGEPEICTQDCPDSESSSGPGENTGAIVGGVLGGAVLVGAAAAAVAYFMRKDPVPPPASAAPAAMGPTSNVQTNPLYQDPEQMFNPLYE